MYLKLLKCRNQEKTKSINKRAGYTSQYTRELETLGLIMECKYLKILTPEPVFKVKEEVCNRTKLLQCKGINKLTVMITLLLN